MSYLKKIPFCYLQPLKYFPKVLGINSIKKKQNQDFSIEKNTEVNIPFLLFHTSFYNNLLRETSQSQKDTSEGQIL